jgi:hypothetical protein
MKLVGSSSLQAIFLYRSTNYTLQFGCELIQWFIASFYLASDWYKWVPKLLQSHPLLEIWSQFCSAGKASLHGYGAEQFQWVIA